MFDPQRFAQQTTFVRRRDETRRDHFPPPTSPRCTVASTAGATTNARHGSCTCGFFSIRVMVEASKADLDAWPRARIDTHIARGNLLCRSAVSPTEFSLSNDSALNPALFTTSAVPFPSICIANRSGVIERAEIRPSVRPSVGIGG